MKARLAASRRAAGGPAGKMPQGPPPLLEDNALAWEVFRRSRSQVNAIAGGMGGMVVFGLQHQAVQVHMDALVPPELHAEVWDQVLEIERLYAESYNDAGKRKGSDSPPRRKR